MLNNSLIASDRTPFRFGVNENGEYGYIITDSEGADSVVPFKSVSENCKILYNDGIGIYGSSISKTSGDITIEEDGIVIGISSSGGGNGSVTFSSTFNINGESKSATLNQTDNWIGSVTKTDIYVYPVKSGDIVNIYGASSASERVGLNVELLLVY